MNLIKASFSDKYLHLFSSAVVIPLTDKTLLERRMPTEFIAGVRPRDIIITRESNVMAEIRFQGIVTFIEMLGDDIIIEVSIGSNNLLVSTTNISNNFYPGEKIELGIEYSKIHYFNQEGMRID
jgi:multiple sugar transport system ATP-binding protein